MLALVINMPLAILGIIVLYRETSLAAIIAFLITTIGPLATLGFILKYREMLKKGTKKPNISYRAISLVYNYVLILSVFGCYIFYGLTEKSIYLLPLMIISAINILIVWQPQFFMGEISNVN